MEQTDFGMIEPKVELEIIDENEAGKNLPVKEEILKLQDQVNNEELLFQTRTLFGPGWDFFDYFNIHI